MGLLVILIGVLVLALVNAFWGLVIIVIGLILVFFPPAPYGYTWYRGRRRPPP